MSNKFPTHQVLFSRDKKGSCKCIVQRQAFDRPMLVLTSVASLPIQFIYTPQDWFYCFTLFGVQKCLHVEQWNRGDKNAVCLHIPFDKNLFHKKNNIVHPARCIFLCLMLQCALFFHANHSVAFKQTMAKFCVASRPQSVSGKSTFHFEREQSSSLQNSLILFSYLTCDCKDPLHDMGAHVTVDMYIYIYISMVNVHTGWR